MLSATDKHNLTESVKAWEKMSDEDVKALDNIPQYLVHHISRLAFYAKKYLDQH